MEGSKSEMTPLENRTVGEVVAEDYARVAAFKRLGIDFCCGGRRTLREACERAEVAYEELASQLRDIDDRRLDAPDTHDGDLDSLIDHIVAKHHRYVREALPLLRELSTRVAKVHGKSRPELAVVRDLVTELATELESHMQAEEEQVFPDIRRLVSARGDGATELPEIGDSIGAMEADHEHAGEIMARLRRVSDGFTPPEGACTTYRATYANLAGFEEDLHRHVHLENNVLFPRAAALQKELALWAGGGATSAAEIGGQTTA